VAAASTGSDVQIFEILNRIVTLVFDLKRAQLFEIFEYLQSPISCKKLIEQNDADFSNLAATPSNQQNQQTTSTGDF